MHPINQRVKIRAFEPSDLPAFTEMLNMPGVIAGTLQQPFRSLAERQRLIEGFCPQVNIVAEREGSLIGHACLHLTSDVSCRHSGSIDVVVRDDHWCMGVGLALVEVLLDQADNSIGLRRVELTALADNHRAIALYERLGFQREGIYKDYAFKAGRFVDAIPMARIKQH
ncbi:GNAT family N-acetyltransferase [Rhodobacter sphaeroides]|uniref:GNAT family N-acetyltransferase n=1 Tax=Cereibacter sphaeroides TaxID=1063 RepID=UPI001325B40C|nr:GNAT family N-acetyltransferase [Cereibacter sphaeroides]MWP38478.1 GNAT family N-acetyltransferase [Cereibacter sphaeroides]